MEDLIELVAASFARHGIECPAGDPQLVWGQPPQAKRQLPTLVATLDPLPPSRRALQSQPGSQSIITEKARKKFARRDGACPVSLSSRSRAKPRDSGRKPVLALDH